MQTAPPDTSGKNMRDIMNVALGHQKADLVLIHADIVNVYTGELLRDQGIGVSGRWIAYVGKNIAEAIGPDTHVIDVAGKIVIPGLIDGHTHLAWTATPYEFLRYILKGGTTALVTETLEPYPVAGLPGVLDYLAALADQPIKIFATAPGIVSISPRVQQLPLEDLKIILDQAAVLGLGETYWQAVFQNPELILPRLEAALKTGKRLEGHTAGASEKKLNAVIATGISSCHEPIKAQEALDRLRLGLHVMAREGSIRRDLEELSKIKASGADLRRMILVTDGISPEDLITHGYMEHVVQKAIDYGFEPIEAIQMATLNVAEHFSLDHLVGGIAPGRYADLVVIPDIETIQAEVVISSGRVIAQHAEVLEPPRRHQFAPDSLASVRLPHPVSESDFSLTVARAEDTAEVRVISMVTDLVTAEKKMRLPLADEQIRADVQSDILKIAAVDRTHEPGKVFVGLIHGFSLKSGAFASSAAWDTTDIVVIGSSEQDMATAVNRVGALQGGYVLADRGDIVAELPMPVFGILSDLPLEQIADRVHRMKQALADRGVHFPDPMLSLITLTGAAIPFLRVCDEGLVSLKDGRRLELISSH